jgi:hypothetical protein
LGPQENPTLHKKELLTFITLLNHPNTSLSFFPKPYSEIRYPISDLACLKSLKRIVRIRHRVTFIVIYVKHIDGRLNPLIAVEEGADITKGGAMDFR